MTPSGTISVGGEHAGSSKVTLLETFLQVLMTSQGGVVINIKHISFISLGED
jgi:ABC-type Mn2+/Zn2+ transport system ATPase subunit